MSGDGGGGGGGGAATAESNDDTSAKSEKQSPRGSGDTDPFGEDDFDDHLMNLLTGPARKRDGEVKGETPSARRAKASDGTPRTPSFAAPAGADAAAAAPAAPAAAPARPAAAAAAAAGAGAGAVPTASDDDSDAAETAAYLAAFEAADADPQVVKVHASAVLEKEDEQLLVRTSLAVLGSLGVSLRFTPTWQRLAAHVLHATSVLTSVANILKLSAPPQVASTPEATLAAARAAALQQAAARELKRATLRGELAAFPAVRAKWNAKAVRDGGVFEGRRSIREGSYNRHVDATYSNALLYEEWHTRMHQVLQIYGFKTFLDDDAAFAVFSGVGGGAGGAQIRGVIFDGNASAAVALEAVDDATAFDKIETASLRIVRWVADGVNMTTQEVRIRAEMAAAAAGGAAAAAMAAAEAAAKAAAAADAAAPAPLPLPLPLPLPDAMALVPVAASAPAPVAPSRPVAAAAAAAPTNRDRKDKPASRAPLHTARPSAPVARTERKSAAAAAAAAGAAPNPARAAKPVAAAAAPAAPVKVVSKPAAPAPAASAAPPVPVAAAPPPPKAADVKHSVPASAPATAAATAAPSGSSSGVGGGVGGVGPKPSVAVGSSANPTPMGDIGGGGSAGGGGGSGGPPAPPPPPPPLPPAPDAAAANDTRRYGAALDYIRQSAEVTTFFASRVSALEAAIPREFRGIRAWLNEVQRGLGTLAAHQFETARLPANVPDAAPMRLRARTLNAALDNAKIAAQQSTTAAVNADLVNSAANPLRKQRDEAAGRLKATKDLLQRRSIELVRVVRQAAALKTFVSESVSALGGYRALTSDLFREMFRPAGAEVPLPGYTAPRLVREQDIAAGLERIRAQPGATLNDEVDLLSNFYQAQYNQVAVGDDRVVLAKNRADLLSARAGMLHSGVRQIESVAVATQDPLRVVRQGISDAQIELKRATDELPAGVQQRLTGVVNALTNVATVAGDGKVAMPLTEYEQAIFRDDVRLRDEARNQARAMEVVRDVYRDMEDGIKGDLRKKNTELKEAYSVIKVLRDAETNRRRLAAVLNRYQVELKRVTEAAAASAAFTTSPPGASAGIAAGAAAAAAAAPPPPGIRADVEAKIRGIAEEGEQISARVDQAFSSDFLAAYTAGGTAAVAGTNPAAEASATKLAIEGAELKAGRRLFDADITNRELKRQLKVVTDDNKALRTEFKTTKTELDRERTAAGSAAAQRDILITGLVQSKSAADEVLAAALMPVDASRHEALWPGVFELLKDAPGDGNPRTVDDVLISLNYPPLSGVRKELSDRIVDLARKLNDTRFESIGSAMSTQREMKTPSAEVVLVRYHREMMKWRDRIQSDTEKSVEALERKAAKPLRDAAEFQSKVEQALLSVAVGMKDRFVEQVLRTVSTNLGTALTLRTDVQIEARDVTAQLFADATDQWLERGVNIRWTALVGGNSRAQLAAAYKRTARAPEDDHEFEALFSTVMHFTNLDSKDSKLWDQYRPEVKSLAVQSRVAGERVARVLEGIRTLANASFNAILQVELDRETGSFAVTLRDNRGGGGGGAGAAVGGPGPVVLMWPRVSHADFDVMKDLRQRTVDAERRGKRSEDELKRQQDDVKVRMKEAKELREDYSKAVQALANETRSVSVRVGAPPPLHIGQYEPFDAMQDSLVRWLRDVRAAFLRRVPAGGAGGGSGGRGGDGGPPNDPALSMELIRSARVPTPSPYHALIALFKAVAGECGRLDLVRVVARDALPLEERRARVAGEAAGRALAGYFENGAAGGGGSTDERPGISAAAAALASAAAAEGKSAPGSFLSVAEDEAERKSIERVQQIVEALAHADTFESALMQMVTAQMWSSIRTAMHRLKTKHVKEWPVYRDVPTVAILTSQTLFAPMMHLLSALFRQRERRAHVSKSARDGELSADADAAAIDQSQRELLQGTKRGAVLRYVFEGNAPALTADNVWQFEHFEEVPSVPLRTSAGALFRRAAQF